jgi:hypothetical protein
MLASASSQAATVLKLVSIRAGLREAGGQGRLCSRFRQHG